MSTITGAVTMDSLHAMPQPQEKTASTCHRAACGLVHARIAAYSVNR